MYVISKTIPLISWFPLNPITTYDPNINTDPATTKPNTAVRRRLKDGRTFKSRKINFSKRTCNMQDLKSECQNYTFMQYSYSIFKYNVVIILKAGHNIF